jgi:hypothetical protein
VLEMLFRAFILMLWSMITVCVIMFCKKDSGMTSDYLFSSVLFLVVMLLV